MKAVFDQADHYVGPDRRATPERRTTSDRRDDIRFEPAKIDRRVVKDRRKREGWDSTGLR